MRDARRRVRLTSAPQPFVEPSRRGAPVVPFMSLSQLEQSAVEEAIVVAWSRVPAAAITAGIDLFSADEEPVTRLLRCELDALRRDATGPVPGFSEREFQHIPESEATPRASGRLESQNILYPDLVIRPVIIPRAVPPGKDVEYGMFIECKILDSKKSHHSIRAYCLEGIIRFVSGGYAAAMPNAVMLAYVRSAWDVPTNLTAHLNDAKYRHEYQIQRMPELSGYRTQGRIPVYTSHHRRDGVRIWDKHMAGTIIITHLWLDCRAQRKKVSG